MRRKRGDALAASHVPQLDGLVERLRQQWNESRQALEKRVGKSSENSRGKRMIVNNNDAIPHCRSRAKALTPETSKFDCGLKRQEKTKLVWPLNSTNASPVSALQSLRVLSSLAVAMYDAVGDHATSG
jgi:hypothetical protein